MNLFLGITSIFALKYIEKSFKLKFLKVSKTKQKLKDGSYWVLSLFSLYI